MDNDIFDAMDDKLIEDEESRMNGFIIIVDWSQFTFEKSTWDAARDAEVEDAWPSGLLPREGYDNTFDPSTLLC
ncbi:hypothetical protein LSH36_748g02078 [Paralvinella palmiformis]|uniref:Uncharacterized protein n=1 Tax=Paralvinella palmiformis TaxID=53620 RepID=A0AAD9MUG6_9ANNE|nr:hypothetical protein LSH36_748g02078 [Paralvinella palmiformis]